MEQNGAADGVSTPGIISMIDTEQRIVREFYVKAESDAYDFPIEFLSEGAHRPYKLRLTYRVNRGSSEPHWYLFQARVYGSKVLKGGKLSSAFSNHRHRDYYPEKMPEWVWEIGKQLMPVVPVEKTAPGV